MRRALLLQSSRTTTSLLQSPARARAPLPVPRRALASSLVSRCSPAASARDHQRRPADAGRRARLSSIAMASSVAPGDGAPPASVDWASLGLTPNPENEDVAVLGGGCFWCIEAAFNKMKGCSSAISGYAGGHVDRPTYEEVCRKTTGHAEVVAVYFNPAVVSYETVLRVFFALHNPTTPDQQGNDKGPQYRSALYTIGDAQRETAERVMAEVREARIWGDAPLVTELAPLGPGASRFHPAEPVHQRYFDHSPENPYCQFVVAPKVSKFRQQFAHLLK